MNFYTSDTHFCHRNILRFCNRPFASIEEHDEELIKRWNEVVGPNDDVYHLGDVLIGNPKRIPDIMKRCNGRKHLIHGNHDYSKTKKLDCWTTSQSYLEVKEGDDLLILLHYPMRFWNKAHWGSYHLYGHCHGSAPPVGRSLDVGVDSWDYRPTTLAQIKERLTNLGIIDNYRQHHDPVGDE